MVRDAVYRRNNGRRLTQAGHADRVAHTVVGLMLAQAFVAARSQGYRLAVDKLDGVPHQILKPAGATIGVDVAHGVVTRSRVSPLQ